MILSFITNESIRLVALISFLFCIFSVANAMSDVNFSNYSYLFVLRYSMFDAVVIEITMLLLILILVINLNCNVFASRQIFAFARDRDLPFSQWISHVHSRFHVSVNVFIFICEFIVLIFLINIDFSVVFNAIISLQLTSMMLIYIMSVTCVFYRRLKHFELLLKARWSLDRFELLINEIVLLWTTYIFFWCFWSIQTSIEFFTFNWSHWCLLHSSLSAALPIFWGQNGSMSAPCLWSRTRNRRLA